MTQETLNKLWTQLFTMKAKGMGFGLSICKRIVEAHGGSINAESTVGKGTKITIVIPAGTSPTQTQTALANISVSTMVIDQRVAASIR